MTTQAWIFMLAIWLIILLFTTRFLWKVLRSNGIEESKSDGKTRS